MWRSRWMTVLNRAEKLVGYPASFLNLRFLLSDELSNVAVQVRKLVGTRHPLLKTARGLFGNKNSFSQTRGLIVLLISRSVSLLCNGQTHASGILPGQRSLAEIAETIHAAMEIHKGVMNLDLFPETSTLRTDMELGNKMATLSGDFLLASASKGLADLQNPPVVSLVSRGISDMVEAEFTSMGDTTHHLSDRQFDSSEEPDILLDLARPLGPQHWEEYVHLSRGSLLGRCCRGAVVLTGADPEIENAVQTFAEEWSYLHRLAEEVQLLGLMTHDNLGISGARFAGPPPSLLHILFSQTSGGDAADFSRAVNRQEAALVLACTERLTAYADRAKSSLAKLPSSESTKLLHEMVSILCNRHDQ